ncbi:MAG: CRISPR-associated helicase Cas3' [Rhodobacteraceae bacterium]|nr:CRISPR-associated helicase Cas3' [Paracoccaceae bacterium]
MLDVAAVAELLVAPLALPGSLRDALVVLAALHDLGKINEQFRRMIRGEVHHGPRHWQVSELLLQAHDDLLAARLGSRKQRRFMLYAATAGHHGRPPDLGEAEARRAMLAVGLPAVDAAGAAIEVVLDLWPDSSLADLGKDQARDLSWWLPGLVSTADWIGSNPGWFPAVNTPGAWTAYLARAREQAAVAVAQAGMAGVAPAGGALFDFALRPMQAACAEIDLPAGPTLAVIEDETGAGKTEAALILAQRMLRAGKGRGLYVALPTMATSDAMFRRARDVVGRMFTPPPTLTLAHGRAGLSADFRDLVVGADNAPEDVSCTPWLADGRRRALLADVGVGTIDQALLAALPTRFHTLRHFALSSKILIVDEVHDLGEPYIAEVLLRLLQMHRQAGGSAILLTATLPLALRARLMAIYGQAPVDPAYPALSIAGAAARRGLPQVTGARGAVTVDRLADADTAVTTLAGVARAGAACVWVRNAVDDAIAAVRALRAQGVPADLLHARFALADRKRIERAVLERFGKDGQGRAGRVLVGTQVLESSLDLDFDVMVSDLAPMASLIQRAGRLWRHMDRRPAPTRPGSGPVLHVVAPDPADRTDAQWLTRVLDRGAWVYPLADQWRTAEVLFRIGRIVAPSGLRALIEAVHGAEAGPVPPGLEGVELDDEGQDRARAAHAWQNVVDLSLDFRTASRGDDDAQYPTRLGEPVQTLALATEGLEPWGGDWALAEVSVARRRLRGLDLPDQQAPAIRAIKADWPAWKRDAVTICPVGQGGRICDGLAYDAELGLLFS